MKVLGNQQRVWVESPTRQFFDIMEKR